MVSENEGIKTYMASHKIVLTVSDSNHYSGLLLGN